MLGIPFDQSRVQGVEQSRTQNHQGAYPEIVSWLKGNHKNPGQGQERTY